MASSARASRLLIAILLGFLAMSIPPTAKACRSFYFSSYSVSVRRHSSAATFEENRSLVSLGVDVGNNDDNDDNPSLVAQMFDGDLPDDLEIENEGRTRCPFRNLFHGFISSFSYAFSDIVRVALDLVFSFAIGRLAGMGYYYLRTLLSERYGYVDDDQEIDSPTEYVKIPAATALAMESV